MKSHMNNSQIALLKVFYVPQLVQKLRRTTAITKVNNKKKIKFKTFNKKLNNQTINVLLRMKPFIATSWFGNKCRDTFKIQGRLLRI